MKILFYRYGNICEPDIIQSFQKVGLTVCEECTEMTDKTLTPGRQLDLLDRQLKRLTAGEAYLFLFSVNYFPAIAEFCHITGIPYVCWTVDCPVLELFSNSIRYDTNFIFLFDHAQYEYFRPQNPEHIFYLPLATNVSRWDPVLQKGCPPSFRTGNPEVSFVGSLYSEKSKYNTLTPLPKYTEGFLTGLMEAQLVLYGCNILEASLTEPVINDLKAAAPSFYSPADTFTDTDAYVVANDYLGYKLAEIERIRTLNLLAQHFPVTLFTRSHTDSLTNVHVRGGVKTLSEMPFVFAESRINLNITMRPIETGLSLRVYDIMGCGGFLLTNYQAELPEYFEIGTDLEAYASMEELLDKTSYYLQHDTERRTIARNGYEKVKQYHTYDRRIEVMIRVIWERMG